MLELCAGVGGSPHGRCRVDVLLECARELAASPFAPELVWRAVGASCEQRPQRSDADEAASRVSAASASATSSAEADSAAAVACLAMYSPELHGLAGDGVKAEDDDVAAEWPVDGVIRQSALAACEEPESLFEAAISCMWARCVLRLKPDISTSGL